MDYGVDPVTGEILPVRAVGDSPQFTGQDYMAELDRLRREKNANIAEYSRLGTELAQATVDLKRTETTVAYRLKAAGMAATFVTKFIDGEDEVADALLRKLSLEAERDAVDKKIASLMQDINTERMQVEREQPKYR